MVALIMIGCGESSRNGARENTAAARSDSAIAPDTTLDRETVLFLGTSLTAGLGLSSDQAYPALIQQKIDSAGLPFRVVNAGVSGETSAGALSRVDWLLRQPFDVLVLETGANDMLRGTDLDSTEANIQAIIDRVRDDRPDVRIILAGMLAPPNLGPEYADRFRRLYPEIAARNDVALIPFLLQDVGGVPSLNQADGMHPNARGEKIVADNVWRVLAPVLRDEAGQPSNAAEPARNTRTMAPTIPDRS